MFMLLLESVCKVLLAKDEKVLLHVLDNIIISVKNLHQYFPLTFMKFKGPGHCYA